MKIVIDAGHGGDKAGAGGWYSDEKTINLRTALVLYGFLRGYGHDVRLTRSRDIDVSLHGRVKLSNEFNADLFLSLHCNGSENPRYSGIECYTSIGETESDQWAGKFQSALLARFPERKDFAGKGTSEENFYVLRKTKSPAVLIEMEFITNQAGEEFLNIYFPEIAETIAGVMDKA